MERVTTPQPLNTLIPQPFNPQPPTPQPPNPSTPQPYVYQLVGKSPLMVISDCVPRPCFQFRGLFSPIRTARSKSLHEVHLTSQGEPGRSPNTDERGKQRSTRCREQIVIIAAQNENLPLRSGEGVYCACAAETCRACQTCEMAARLGVNHPRSRL